MPRGIGAKRGRGRGRGRGSGSGRASVARDTLSPAIDDDFACPRVETFGECQLEAVEQSAGVIGPSVSVLRDVPGCEVEFLPPSLEVDLEAASVRQERSTRQRKLCDAIDAEVASRAAIIRAHTASRTSALHAQLDLQLSKLTIEERIMPVDDFLSSFLQNLKDGTQDSQFPQSRLPSSYAKVADDMTRLASSALNTPCLGPALPDMSLAKENRNPHLPQDSRSTVYPETTSWADYQSWLQSLGYKTGPTALGNTNFNTPMDLAHGTTPKTVRLPKPGESMLSINGSPLGKFGETPGTTGRTRITRSQTRGYSSKRSLRDL